MRSDTPSEGSESAGDEARKSGDIKRNKSLKSLKLRGGDDESGLFDKLRSYTGTANNAEKQKRKSIKKKQKEEVCSTVYTIVNS